MKKWPVTFGLFGLVFIGMSLIGTALDLHAKPRRKAKPESFFSQTRPHGGTLNKHCKQAIIETVYRLRGEADNPNWHDPAWKNLIKKDPHTALSILLNVNQFREVFDEKSTAFLVALKHTRPNHLTELLMNFLKGRLYGREAVEDFTNQFPLFAKILLLPVDDQPTEIALERYALHHVAASELGAVAPNSVSFRFILDSQFYSSKTSDEPRDTYMEVHDLLRYIKRSPLNGMVKIEGVPAVVREVSTYLSLHAHAEPSAFFSVSDGDSMEAALSRYEEILGVFTEVGIDYSDAMILTEVALSGLAVDAAPAILVTQDFHTIWKRLIPFNRSVQSFSNGLHVTRMNETNLIKINLPGEDKLEFYILLGFPKHIPSALEDLAELPETATRP